MSEKRECIVIKGIGSYVPEHVLTNEDLSMTVDTTDEWIRTRTGIKERHIAADDQATSDLCVHAAKSAIENAKIKPADIDLIMVGTISPDMLTPATAVFVQHKLGVNNIPCFDFNSACAGFQYGLEIAKLMLLSSKYKNILLICGDKLSVITDWNDRTTCILFGDGAGAVVLSREQSDQPGIVDVLINSDGAYSGVLNVPAGGSQKPASEQTVRERKHYLRMDGREVFKLAVQKMWDSIAEILRRNDLTMDEISHVVTHQANIRIVDAIADRLNISREKMRITLDKFGNTSASSVVLAIDHYRKAGIISCGELILTAGFGAGLTWGSAIVRL
ncbi:MAG: ketoacyl-ACP synthase III [Puniceicoccales bacterium]|jgi:3-oxoacyl-[acyl-carrier-protein] synthase-3|nr:ketoacyl-ACP synthase III [Puniceicoccales bacterium]